MREAIFQRFEKLDSFKSGMGLGLNIYKQIALLMYGSVSLDTEYVGEVRFLFKFPVKI
ncbi:HAMP domain-containing histidine kinase [Bacteroides helcogenes]|uniref:HAMP domain-containing histidine kinase n=1 Tax=Bacteroides helcogenes TaxID=290053 RepID=UPI0002D8B30C|nr:HAMP domain-containing histidine kinase [Bacteroides helcogenes]MDY5239787.1 HAMP domain-containing histidine kinase [Bacteroides helcogenes]